MAKYFRCSEGTSSHCAGRSHLDRASHRRAITASGQLRDSWVCSPTPVSNATGQGDPDLLGPGVPDPPKKTSRRPEARDPSPLGGGRTRPCEIGPRWLASRILSCKRAVERLIGWREVRENAQRRLLRRTTREVGTGWTAS